MAILSSSDNSVNVLISTKADTKGVEETNAALGKFGKVSVAAFGLAAGAAMALANDAINAVTSSIQNAVSRVDTLNNFPRIMSNFGVSAGDAKSMIDKLDKGVRGLPTTLDSIVQLAEGFVPLTKNTQEATDTALALNNAILAGGRPAQVQAAALEQFQQALSKGVPDLQDWKSLEVAMPAQLQQVTKELGFGTGALADYHQNGLGLYQAMKDGKITMDDFNQAIIKLNSDGVGGLPSLAQQAKNATGGIQTGFDIARTAVTRGVGDIIQAIGSKNISDAITNVGKGFETSMKMISENVGPALEIVSRLGQQVGDYLGPKVSALAHVIMTQLLPTLTNLWHGSLEPIAATIGRVVVGAVGLLVDILTALTSKASILLPIVLTVTTAFLAYRTAVAVSTAVMTVYNGILLATGTQYTLLNGQLITYRTASAAATVAQTALNAAMSLNPIGIVIGLLAGLAAVLWLVTSNTDSTTTSTDALNAARKQEKDIADAARDSENQLRDAQMGVEGANLRVETATRNYNDAVKTYGDKSLEARDAAYQLKQANDDLKDSTVNLNKKLDDQLISLDGINVQFDKLNGRSVNYNVNGQNITAWKQNGKNFFGGGFASGGFTGTGGENEPAGIVHKGEYVVPKKQVDQATGMPKLSSSINVTQNIYNQVDMDKSIRELGFMVR